MSFRAFAPCFVLFTVLGIGCIWATAAQDSLPTSSEIKEAFDAGQYPQVLQKLNRVLILKGDAARNYDRHGLLEIKGETELRMKSMPAAAQAFADASKEAPDGPSAATDIATEQLIRKSTGTLQYQPKGHDPADKTKQLPPIDILDLESRKKAIVALLTDELAATEVLVKNTRQAKSLTPIQQALPTIRNTRWIEMAATEKDDKTKAMAADLATRAKSLLETSLKDMKESADDLERVTMEVTVAHVPVNDKQTGRFLYFLNKYKYRGPTSRQMQSIQEIVNTCLKIFNSCDELGGSLGANGKEFDGVKEQAKAIGTKANTLATKDWRTAYDQPPPTPPPAAK